MYTTTAELVSKQGVIRSVQGITVLQQNSDTLDGADKQWQDKVLADFKAPFMGRCLCNVARAFMPVWVTNFEAELMCSEGISCHGVNASHRTGLGKCHRLGRRFDQLSPFREALWEGVTV